MKIFELKQIIKEEIDNFLGRGGSKDVYLSQDPNQVIKKFTGEINKENLIKEKKLGEKFPKYIAQIFNLDFKKGIMTQEKIDPKKFKLDIQREFIKLPDNIQNMFDESGLDDEFEFFITYPQYIQTKELKDKIQKIDNFIKNILTKSTGTNIDYPNINNIGYDKDGHLKLLEIFY